MVLWEKNYGTIERTMALWKKLWYYTKTMELWFTMELRFTKEKKLGNLPKTLIYSGKKYANIPNKLNFLKEFIALQLWFNMEKLWYYGKKLCYYNKL